MFDEILKDVSSLHKLKSYYGLITAGEGGNIYGGRNHHRQGLIDECHILHTVRARSCSPLCLHDKVLDELLLLA